MSRELLAVKSGLSWSAIAQIEAGRRPNPRAETIAALSRGLGVTTDYLLGAPTPSLLSHQALIYQDQADFGAIAGPLVRAGLTNGDSTLVVTTPSNIEALRSELDDGDRVSFAISEDWYVSPRAAFARYREFVVAALADGAPWLRIIGEPIWSGLSDENVARWARYESQLNLSFASYPLTLVCPYNKSVLPPEILDHAEMTHRQSITSDETVDNDRYSDPSEYCLTVPRDEHTDSTDPQ
jgi:transcriptional regulator with XRE-family HTH domain